MKTASKVIVLLSFLFASKGTMAQTVNANLDSLFATLVRYKQINGNALIAQQGHVIFNKSFGFANFKDSIANTDKTEFSLASVSKIFTSAAVLQLRDKKKFKLDDPLVKYLPKFPYPDITIRNLLSHTSGLPDYQLYEEQIDKNPGKIFTNADVLPSLKLWTKALPFKPGQKWQYSNTNFCLLALLVEKVSGMDFKTYLQKYVFMPAHMSDTYFVTNPGHQNDPRKADNYEYPFLFSSTRENVDSIKRYRWRTYNAIGFVGQGNIETTTADMLKFDEALYSGGILKLPTLNEAFTPTRLNNGTISNAGIGIGKASYGLGWFILADTSAGKIVWHTGGQPGALSIFIRNISKKQTVILFDNAFDKSIYQNGMNMLAILNNQPVQIPKNSPTQNSKA
jgi:CubicO group peptidase (beta-lactamase class C family)